MAVVTAMPSDREWTADDLSALPDDGLRYELVDGVLLVSPAPVPLHQRVVTRLATLLNLAAPSGYEALVSPVSYRINDTRELQPDVVVVAADQVTGSRLSAAPLLVVEVLSPRTKVTDLTLKRHLYERAGVPAYWIIDTEQPSLTVLEIVEGSYSEVALVRGDQPFDARRPFAVRVVPAELVG